MTRKDYIIIAAALLESKPESHWDANKKAQWLVSCNRIADALANDNPRFNRGRFLNACGVEDE